MVLPIAGSERSNFFYALALLPKTKREAMRRVYDFCRHTDDIADDENATVEMKRQRLKEWREDVNACYNGNPSHPVLRALTPVLHKFHIPQEYLLALIDGVEMDFTHSRYETFEELKKYCYGVASTVGLISLQVFGYTHESTRAYAVDLGYALQLTNILRDIKQDAANGRIYLPLEDLRRFNYDEASLLASRNDERFTALMEFEATRARQYYAQARSHLDRGDRKRMFAAETMDAIYFRLLQKIERANYDVFTERIAISNSRKIMIALRYWIGSHFIFSE
jgi:15-cis-phytoene synthase